MESDLEASQAIRAQVCIDPRTEAPDRLIISGVGLGFMAPQGAATMAFRLGSDAFEDGGEIPARYTCEGEDLSPPLAWSEPPPGTRSLLLIVDDPDAPDPRAPKLTWVHWVIVGLPPTAGELQPGVEASALPGRARFGRNDWKREDYGGPCPPIGRHRYFHKLYALDIEPPRAAATKADLERAMQGHVLARAELVGTYQKQGR